MTDIQASAIIYADYRHSPDEHVDVSGLKELKINERNIGFFDDVISSSCSFYEIESNEWLLVFFKGSAFEKQISVITSNTLIKYHSDTIGAAFRVQNNRIDEDVLKIAKGLLGSQSLKVGDFCETSSNSYIVSVRRGFLYVSETPGQFERATILNALAHAYKLIMHEVSAKVSTGIINKDNKQLLEWTELGFQFNAAFYSRYPIKLENREIGNFWKAFESHWHITEINDEFTRQLASIHTLIQFEEGKKLTEKHHHQTTKLTVLIAVVGLLITLLSTYIAHMLGWNS